MTYKSVQRSLAGWSNLRYVARRLQAWFNRREAIEQAERARRSVRKVRRWHVHRWRLLPLFVLAGIWVIWALYSLVVVAVRIKDKAPVTWVPRAGKAVCGSGYESYCAVVKDSLWPSAVAALAYVTFVLGRYTSVRRKYQKVARNEAKELVQTAGGLIGEVVGRDQLCEVLIADLQDPASRRPHVLVGAMGTGKTAVLVKLTQTLAGKNVVPVPIRLRDAQEDLDFEDMAQTRLKQLVNKDLRSDGQADRIWRQLRRDDRVVVVADGLEEALQDRDDRNNILRRAIRRAVKDKLPLIIASRPHDPLRAMEVVVTELEPLGEGPALEYAARDSGGPDPEESVLARQRMTRLVEVAQVADAPLYLRLIRDLNAAGRLWAALAGELLPDKPAEDTARDRVRLRLKLLNGWKDALIEGYLYEDSRLDKEGRRGVVEVLSALACVGLARKRRSIDFHDLEPASNRDEPVDDDEGPRNGQTRPGENRHRRNMTATIRGKLRRELDKVNQGSLLQDLPLAATLGMELGIVEAHEQYAHFQHSVIQAYLGSRYLAVALDDPDYLGEAFREPSVEFLMALVFGFQHADEPERIKPRQLTERRSPLASPLAVLSVVGGAAAKAVTPASFHPRKPPPEADDGWPMARDFLRQKAHGAAGRKNVKALEIYSTLIELDSFHDNAEPAGLIEAIAGDWAAMSRNTVALDRSVEEAKLRLMRRLGEALRKAAARTGPGDEDKLAEAYRGFYELLSREELYPIRLAGALEIGDGADQAAEALKPCMEYATRRDEPAAEQRKSDPGSDGTARAADDQDRRKGILCAWLAPLMYHSSLPQTTPTRNGGRQSNAPESAAGNNLDKFLSWLTERSRSSEESRRSLSLEIALAQGFRLAANKRGYDHTPYRYRQAVMIDRAEQALKYSRYWFSQLALIQALTLLSLPTDPAEELASNGHGSDPRRLVEYWVAQAGSQTVAAHGDGGRHPHPFVRAAGELCVLALLTRRPAEYCWIDEPTVIHRVGSHSRDRRSQYNQRSWIMSSVGWSALHPQAQRLLADVQVMLNLTERYEDTADADRRLPRADRHDLPPCITRDRSPLDPGRSSGSAKVSEPGSNCIDNCPFRLCPYPAKGQPHYAELSESFCRWQISLLGRWYDPRGGARWQHQPRSNLKAFWRLMANRERPKPLDPSRPSEERAGGGA